MNNKFRGQAEPFPLRNVSKPDQTYYTLPCPTMSFRRGHSRFLTSPRNGWL